MKLEFEKLRELREEGRYYCCNILCIH